MVFQYFITSYLLHLFLYWGYCIYWSLYNLHIFTKKELYIIYDVLKFQFTIIPFLGIFIYLLYDTYGNKNEIEYSIYEFFDIICFFMALDFTFYFIHRLLHTNLLYKYHKKHHSAIYPFPWSAIYASTIENIFLNFLPLLLLPLLFQIKIEYFVFLTSVATLNSIYTHSTNNVEHAIHHKYYNVNYGITRYPDILFGTFRNNDII